MTTRQYCYLKDFSDTFIDESEENVFESLLTLVLALVCALVSALVCTLVSALVCVLVKALVCALVSSELAWEKGLNFLRNPLFLGVADFFELSSFGDEVEFSTATTDSASMEVAASPEGRIQSKNLAIMYMGG